MPSNLFIYKEMFGGPDRDRTDDLFHAIPKAIMLTVKDLLAGTVGRNGQIGDICYQFATKKPRRAMG